jgi:hypothetical protein
MKLITQDIILTISFLWKISKTKENEPLSLSALWCIETGRLHSIIEPISPLRTTMTTLMIMTPNIA